MAEFDTSLIHTDGYRREARTRPGKRLATPLVYACDEIDRLRTRLQRAEELIKQAYLDGHHDGCIDHDIIRPGWDSERAEESWNLSDIKREYFGGRNDKD